MGLSPLARVLMIGIWTEADDQGVFEWKPLTLKARILPADDGSVEPLLDEIAQAGFVEKFEEDGKGYGAIRNFRKFQRPQKPNAIHPLPDRLKAFIGLVRDQSTTPTRKLIQMEDVGCRREEKDEEKKDRGADAPPMAFSGKVIRLTLEDYDRWKATFHAVPDMHAELTAADAHYADKPPKDGKWFFPVSNWLKRAHEQALEKQAEEASARRSWN